MNAPSKDLTFLSDDIVHNIKGLSMHTKQHYITSK